jgi:hypothetical protein
MEAEQKIQKIVIEEEQRRYIVQALDFIGVPHEEYTLVVELKDGPGQMIVIWAVSGLEQPIAGSYELGNPAHAKFSVVMSFGMMHHRYHILIYDLILMADSYLHPKDGNRNNVLEIALRAAFMEALERVHPSQVMTEVTKRFHFQQNLEDVRFSHTQRTKQSAAIEDLLIRRNIKKNGRIN